ncbi:MAG TPA: YicC family protein [Thermodesulfobacterium geofontis]|nr:YicC family protein [Thermodesulfobacterium geofontis]
MESMTGFGKGVSQTGNYTITVYAKSLNHRYLDISLRIPKRYTFLEEKIRKFVSQNFKRGKIDIQIKYTGTELDEKEISVDISLARKLKKALIRLKFELGFEDPLTFSDFLKFRDYLVLEEKEEELEKLWEEVFPALNNALKELKDSRVKEGSSLKNILEDYLKVLTNEVSQIEKLKEKIIEEKKEKLKTKIEELLKEFNIKETDENRFYQELVYLLDKLDFSEELDRLKSHILHFKNAMEEEYCGKKLDFICQEMFREINTLSHKAQSSEISLIAVKIKDLIEKLREQIQSIA